jgi:uncharacterized protein (TIRG00374 family)
LKKLIIALIKVAISASIIGYLVWDAYNTTSADGENIFEKLAHQQKRWSVLAAAWCFCATAVMLTVIRWWYLVRALELPFRFKDAMRIGFLGYMFNLAPLGIVGGDLLKAVMLAHEYKKSRATAIASVIVDRLIGLYMLFIVASVAILLTGFWKMPNEDIRTICYFTFIFTLVGFVGICVLLTPGVTDGRGTRALGRIPKAGQILNNLIDAVRMYRKKMHVLLIASLMTVGVHCCYAVGLYLIADGLFTGIPPLGDNMVMAFWTAATGAIPLPAGPGEAALEYLYRQFGQPKFCGLIVLLGYRVICVIIAMIGVCYYLSARREVAEVMHEVEQEEEEAGGVA